MVVIGALKAQYNKGRRTRLYYIRGKNGVEIDLVVEKTRRLHGIEIKSSKTPDDSFVVNMKKFSANVAPLESQSVIYSGDDWSISGGGKFINFRDTGSMIDEIGDMVQGFGGCGCRELKKGRWFIELSVIVW